MKLIVAVDEKWGIGKNNALLFRLKKDMAFFRAQTLHKTVVVGANTFDSFPHGALPDRTNIVLDSSNRAHEGALTVSSVEQLQGVLADVDTDNVFVIGGGSVYRLLLDSCNQALVTKVRADGQADVFFPDLDARADWSLVEQSEPIADGEYTIRFCKYVKCGTKG